MMEPDCLEVHQRQKTHIAVQSTHQYGRLEGSFFPWMGAQCLGERPSKAVDSPQLGVFPARLDKAQRSHLKCQIGPVVR